MKAEAENDRIEAACNCDRCAGPDGLEHWNSCALVIAAKRLPHGARVLMLTATAVRRETIRAPGETP